VVASVDKVIKALHPFGLSGRREELVLNNRNLPFLCREPRTVRDTYQKYMHSVGACHAPVETKGDVFGSIAASTSSKVWGGCTKFGKIVTSTHRKNDGKR
jgi:hypothetical protein